MKHHYSIEGLEEPDSINVLSLEQKASVGNLLKSERTGNVYRVVRCNEPKDQQLDAGVLAINYEFTLNVVLVKRGPGVPSCPVHQTPMKPTTEWDLPEFRFYYCPEENCDRRYSVETGHITAQKLPSRG